MIETSLTPEQRRILLSRIGITLLALAAFRAGQWVPLPGLDLVALTQSASLNAYASPRAMTSVMALGVAPLLTAAIFAEALKCFSRRLRQWAATPEGHTMFWRGTVVAALVLASLQARGISNALEAMVPSIVVEPGITFQLGVAASFVGATAFIVLLAVWITRHGVGHGLWVLFAAGLAEKFIQPLILQLPLLSIGALTPQSFLANVALWFAALALAAAVVTALVKATPRMSTPAELVWSPLVAGTVVSLALTAIFLPIVLLAPAVADSVSSGAANLSLALIALATAAIVLARRKSFLPKGERVNVAAATPAIIIMVLFTSAAVFFPYAQTAFLLGAVSLMIIQNVRPATPDTASAPLARQ